MADRSKLAVVRRAPLAVATPRSGEFVELADAIDDSLEMDEAGAILRVKKYRKAQRIIAFSEMTFTTTSFEPVTSCAVAMPTRPDNHFYKFRAQVVYETSNASEGMAVRVRYTGATFGAQRYRVTMGDNLTTSLKTRFEDFSATPAPETAGPGPFPNLGFVELEGGFSTAGGSSGSLQLEVRCETGSPEWVKLVVGTFLHVDECG